MVDLEAIEARAEAASPAPWSWDAIGHGDDERKWSWQVTHNQWDIAVMSDGDSPPPYRPNPKLRQANAIFIAHAREDIPDLLAEIRRLQIDLEIANREIESLLFPRLPPPPERRRIITPGKE